MWKRNSVEYCSSSKIRPRRLRLGETDKAHSPPRMPQSTRRPTPWALRSLPAFPGWPSSSYTVQFCHHTFNKILSPPPPPRLCTCPVSGAPPHSHCDPSLGSKATSHLVFFTRPRTQHIKGAQNKWLSFIRRNTRDSHRLVFHYPSLHSQEAKLNIMQKDVLLSQH